MRGVRAPPGGGGGEGGAESECVGGGGCVEGEGRRGSVSILVYGEAHLSPFSLAFGLTHESKCRVNKSNVNPCFGLSVGRNRQELKI